MKRATSTIGLSLQGFVFASLDQITEVLGEAHVAGPAHGKTTLEWVYEHNGIRFSVYNWTADEHEGENLTQGIVRWHIGGEDMTAVTAFTLATNMPAELKAIADSMDQVVYEYEGKDVTRRELWNLFELVRDPEHWKMPIDTTIDMPSDRDLHLLEYAVGFFAGCQLEYAEDNDGRLHCQAIGYYNAVGA